MKWTKWTDMRLSLTPNKLEPAFAQVCSSMLSVQQTSFSAGRRCGLAFRPAIADDLQRDTTNSTSARSALGARLKQTRIDTEERWTRPARFLSSPVDVQVRSGRIKPSFGLLAERKESVL